ncbi:MAG: FHA domain-containing protein [Acidobacteriota bacterium]|jgi:membrane-bound lytic murein transglycosylase D
MSRRTADDRSTGAESREPSLHVKVEAEGMESSEFTFGRSFRIGRDDDCEIQIQNPGISRHHAEVQYEDGLWRLKDLDSANGVYFQGRRVSDVPLEGSVTAELGLRDAVLTFTVVGAEAPSAGGGATVVEKPPSVTEYVQRYFDAKVQGPVGQQTRMIREAFKVVDKKKRLRYGAVILGILAVTAAISIYTFVQHRELQRQKKIAEEIFYNMKSLELEISKVQTQADQTGNQETQDELSGYRQQQSAMLRNYDRFLEEMEFYEDKHWTATDRVILRVARIFGECELTMPEEFREKVYEYIDKWRTTKRLQQAIRRAKDNGWDRVVEDTMLKYHLPPQFFFLGLQESSYDLKTIGPKTRFGIAKGIWQFIPATALRYRLQVGPLVELPRFDPRDERFTFDKATDAAARYIRDIYNTEAQASGLLVVASYNWGERNVRSLVRRLPENPRDRNFWQLLERYGKRIPKETYDYVFYIVSAAVIGEDPQLFGFDFDNPFQAAASDQTASRAAEMPDRTN